MPGYSPLEDNFPALGGGKRMRKGRKRVGIGGSNQGTKWNMSVSKNQTVLLNKI